MFIKVYFTTYASQIKENFHADFGNALAAVKNMDVDKYYITSYGSKTMTETYILFYHQLDAEFFQGKVSWEGRFFEDKYIISEIQNIQVNPEENAAYVVSSLELENFPLDFFEVQQFGDYYALKPKQ